MKSGARVVRGALFAVAVSVFLDALLRREVGRICTGGVNR